MIDGLEAKHEFDVVNLSKQTFRNGIDSLGRIGEIVGILLQVLGRKKTAELVYLTISESIAGNVKDLAIYLVCWRHLDRLVIHLHGGAGMRLILEGRPPLLGAVNRLFVKRLGGVIVLGESHARMYRDLVQPRRLHIVPNFAQDHLFAEETEIAAKFDNLTPLRLLFLSNLISGKGHEELLTAVAGLDTPVRRALRVDFAGGFESVADEEAFRERIATIPEVHYHGTVHGDAKTDLLRRAHVFCLPTYYPYEGQPISILEAYASGCVVMTTDHSGIRDIFRDPANGIQVEKRSPESIAGAISRVLIARESLRAVGLANRREAASKYRTSTYNAALDAAFRSVGDNVG
jgi:glycosyltransferase involved in cell wall biosynthesis